MREKKKIAALPLRRAAALITAAAVLLCTTGVTAEAAQGAPASVIPVSGSVSMGDQTATDRSDPAAQDSPASLSSSVSGGNLLLARQMTGTARKGIFAGRFSLGQIFDCWKDPNPPVAGSSLRLYRFGKPYDGTIDKGGHDRQFTEADLQNRYFMFEKVDDYGQVALYLYNNDGTPAQGSDMTPPVGNQWASQIQDGFMRKGYIWALGDKGFVFISDNTNNGYGYFISNGTGYNDGGEVTYVPYTGKITDTSLLENYIMSDVPVSSGQFSVQYSANGGAGAPATQIKTDGETLTLSTDIPVKEGCEFLGWAASPDASEAQYLPGGSYTLNAAAVLYAVWRDQPKEAVFSWTVDQEYIYNNTSPELTFSLTGDSGAVTLASSDYTLTCTPAEGGGTLSSWKDAGTYKAVFALTEEGKKRYSLQEGRFSFEHTFTVKPRTVIFAPPEISCETGEKLPAPALTLAAGSAMASGETPAVLGLPDITVKDAVTDDEGRIHNAGSYEILCGGFTKEGRPYENPNYVVTLQHGSLTVFQKSPEGKFSVTPEGAGADGGWSGASITVSPLPEGDYDKILLPDGSAHSFVTVTDEYKTVEFRLSNSVTGAYTDSLALECRSDTQKPVIDNENISLVPEEGGSFLDFGNFSRTDVTVTVPAADQDGLSGLDKLHWKLPGMEQYGEASFDASGEAAFTIPVPTSGQVSCYVTDQAGNKSDVILVGKDGVSDWWVEAAPPSAQEPVITPDEGVSMARGGDGEIWYGGPVTVSSAITDGAEGSGLSKVAVTAAGDGQTAVLMENPGSRIQDYTYSGRMEQEGKNSITLSVTDNAGNGSVKSFTVSIDTSAPSLTPVQERVQGLGVVSETVISDAGAGIDRDSLTVETLSDGHWLPVSYDARQEASGSLRIEFDTTAETDYRVTVSDLLGNREERTWAGGRKLYTLRFASGSPDASGDAPADIECVEGAVLALPDNPFELVRCRFAGWAYDGGLSAPGSLFTMPAANVTLQASWEKELLDVVYVAPSAGSDRTGTGTSGSPLASLEEALEALKPDGVIILEEDYVTDHAVDIDQRLTLDLNGNSLSVSQEVSGEALRIDGGGSLTVTDSAEGGRISGAEGRPAVSTQPGAAVTVEKGIVTGGISGKGDISAAEGSLIYYVTFDGGDGGLTPPPAAVGAAGQLLVLPEPGMARPGYVFVGWEYEGGLYRPGDTVPFRDSNAEATARWSASQDRIPVEGTIRFENGLPADGLTVTLTGAGEGTAETVQTGADGVFRFEAVPAGVWRIEATVPEPVPRKVGISVSIDENGVLHGSPVLVIKQSALAAALEREIAALPKAGPDGGYSSEELKNEESAILSAKASYDALSEIEKRQLFPQSLRALDLVLKAYANVFAVLDADEEQLGFQIEVPAFRENGENMAGLLCSGEELSSAAASGEDISVIMRVRKKEPDALQERERILSAAGASSIGLFLDISVVKRIGDGEETPVSRLPQKVEIRIAIPDGMRDGTDYRVFRCHGDQVTELPAVRDGDFLCIASELFSTYAIAYTPYGDEDREDSEQGFGPDEGGNTSQTPQDGGGANDKSEGTRVLDQVPRTGPPSSGGTGTAVRMPDMAAPEKKEEQWTDRSNGS